MSVSVPLCRALLMLASVTFVCGEWIRNSACTTGNDKSTNCGYGYNDVQGLEPETGTCLECMKNSDQGGNACCTGGCSWGGWAALGDELEGVCTCDLNPLYKPRSCCKRHDCTQSVHRHSPHGHSPHVHSPQSVHRHSPHGHSPHVHSPHGHSPHVHSPHGHYPSSYEPGTQHGHYPSYGPSGNSEPALCPGDEVVVLGVVMIVLCVVMLIADIAACCHNVSPGRRCFIAVRLTWNTFVLVWDSLVIACAVHPDTHIIIWIAVGVLIVLHIGDKCIQKKKTPVEVPGVMLTEHTNMEKA